MKFKIGPSVRPYLEIQRSGISHLIGAPEWDEAYEQSIEADFVSIEPVLPTTAHNILDVGGGIGGISARLYHHYGEQRPVIAVLDGLADPPVVDRSWKTHNDAVATATFMQENGVKDFTMIAPYDEINKLAKFELVISTQAWCFHIPPALYMQKVKAHLAKDGILVVDVRRDKGWMEELHKEFNMLGGVMSVEKWVRVAFQKRSK